MLGRFLADKFGSYRPVFLVMTGLSVPSYRLLNPCLFFYWWL